MILRINIWAFLLLNLPITLAQFFRAPNFDCSRIHPSYCCSTRVRFSCPQLCNSRPCQRTPNFVQPFSPHIPANLPFPGLAPEKSQLPSHPEQTLPPLIDPRTLTPSQSKNLVLPDPPPGIILPPEGTPLSMGTPIPDIDEGDKQPVPPNSQKPIDGFAPARGGHVPSIGAGGSFGPTDINGNNNNFNGNNFNAGQIGPQSVTNNNNNNQGFSTNLNGQLVGMGLNARQGLINTFPEQSTPTPPIQQNTFPTLINFVPTATSPTVHPPAIAPPWPSEFTPESNIFSSTTLQPSSIQTLTPSVAPPKTTSSVVDSNSHQTSRKKAILPPPNTFTETGNEELIELESTDRRSIHVESSGSTARVNRLKDTNAIHGLASEISNTIIVGTNTFLPSPTNNISTTPITTIQEQVEPLPRTTVSDKGFGGWSFKITPSKHARELPIGPTRNEGEFTNNLNSSVPDFTSNQWISNQKSSNQFVKNEGEFTNSRISEFEPNQPNHTNELNSKQTLPPNNGIFSGDKLNGVIDSIFTKRTIDTITSLTGRRPAPRRTGNHRQAGSATAPPPIATNFNQTTQKFMNQMGHFNGSVGGSGKCGTAPDFRPCLDINRANLRLLSCCKSKFLPEGCWSLCRYDTTQADVKKIFDAGKCGILNVAPFLECASQGQDNRPCCQQRQINAKSGPQCEVFCHPRDGLGSLGLQHLSCQHVISDLLQCHHSGLRE